ncbi:MAG: single-stranded DNA-binding protein [Oscillospiraceae bacterium]|jgi:single-strand DNA-binding protein|nr:single-stranded DNA-binding protein [Oscillospiraceae bacterium]
MNNCVMMGRLCGEPELRTTQAGVSVVGFTIAVDRRVKDQDGNRQSDFFRVSAWRQSAEFVQRYFHKGDPIIVTGSVQIREYTDREGAKRTSVEIQAENISFVLSQPRRDGQGAPPSGGYSGNAGGSFNDRTPPPAAAAPSYANAGASDFSEIETDDDDLEGLPF